MVRFCHSKGWGLNHILWILKKEVISKSWRRRHIQMADILLSLLHSTVCGVTQISQNKFCISAEEKESLSGWGYGIYHKGSSISCGPWEIYSILIGKDWWKGFYLRAKIAWSLKIPMYTLETGGFWLTEVNHILKSNRRPSVDKDSKITRWLLAGDLVSRGKKYEDLVFKYVEFEGLASLNI